MKNIVVGIAVVVALGAVAYFFVPPYFSSRAPGTVSISDFAACAGAGYPVLQTSPRQCEMPDGRTFTEVVSNGGASSQDHSDVIKVSNVSAGKKITDSFVVQGSARGTWYFEASFPVVLTDANGKILFQGPAQAKGDWMTTDFVPFTVTLKFTKPSTTQGTLTLKKDNPSGDPSKDDSISIPVSF